jgi:pimeloyl-ACP methyl ester carboxylesterase
MTDPTPGTRAPEPIEDGLFAEIGGTRHWLTLRGRDRTRPVLLILGGPGAGFARAAGLFAPWEEHFVVVQWDQPGGGVTLAASPGGNGDLSLERLTRDGIAVAKHVRARLGVDKLVLLGVSGGSIVGLKMISRRPELFSAYVGTGQFVHGPRQDAISYATVLDDARGRGDRGAVAELEALGRPPYASTAEDAVKSRHAGAFTPAEQAAVGAAMARGGPPAGCIPEGVELPADPRPAGMAAYDQVRGEIAGFDARTLDRRFEVPLILLQGELDVWTVTSEVEAWLDWVDAPAKRLVIVPGGGHSAMFLGDPFLELLAREVG